MDKYGGPRGNPMVGYSPRGCKESEMTKQLSTYTITHTHTHTHTHTQVNNNYPIHRTSCHFHCCIVTLCAFQLPLPQGDRSWWLQSYLGIPGQALNKDL